MGNHQSNPLTTCLDAVCAGRSSCVSYPGDLLYQLTWVKPYNLDIPVTPAAVIRPRNAEEVSSIVNCARENGAKVQARSGGHSFGNFGIGGKDGAVVVDLANLKQFSIDEETWYATVGSGMRLGELDEYLHDNGGRAMAHGTCPGVGIGGHATIGGLGPMSRMWGSALDHVIEVEVVTSDGAIQRASETTNSDLFWALRGAGASFGIITEFTVKTHPEPGHIVEYTYNFSFGSQDEMAELFKTWQDLIGDPNMDRRFSTLFVAQPLGVLITGTFYGTDAEFHETGIPDRLPSGGATVAKLTDWFGHLTHQAEAEAMVLSDLPSAFYTKSLAFRQEDLLSPSSIEDLFSYVGNAKTGTLLWFIIFDSEGGAINDVPANATAYPHRDKIMMYQSYAIGLPRISTNTRNFINGVHSRILRAAPGARSTYAGYIDAGLEAETAQELYWADKLPQLREVKDRWDADDVFHNPQSVSARPAEL
ncbi:Fc.00g106700.m01.CDS01 [Cosmosporella sp. VM-42]